MSDLLYPTLPGLTWSVTKSPTWKTRVQTSVRGRQLRILDQIYPKWKFQLVYSFLNGAPGCTPGHADLQIMMNFYQTVRGAWDNWLFDDPSDNSVVNQFIAFGDGVQTSFQLVREFAGGPPAPPLGVNVNTGTSTPGPPFAGNFREPIIAPHSYGIKFDGVFQDASTFHVDATNGLLFFEAAPAPKVAITADIGFYFRCRFTTDTLDFEEFAKNWWELKRIEFESILL